MAGETKPYDPWGKPSESMEELHHVIWASSHALAASPARHGSDATEDSSASNSDQPKEGQRKKKGLQNRNYILPARGMALQFLSLSEADSGSKSSWSSAMTDEAPHLGGLGGSAGAPRDRHHHDRSPHDPASGSNPQDHVLFGSPRSQITHDSATASSASEAGVGDCQPASGLAQEAIGDRSFVSAGSALHGQDECNPCLFVHTKRGCKNGETCVFCHFPHKRKATPRPAKGKRDRYRKLVNRMEQERLDGEVDDGPESEDEGKAPRSEDGILKMSI